MATVRKQKIVTVCSVVDETSDHDLKYMNNKQSSQKTKLSTYVKTPINTYNLLMLEIFPEVKVSENENYASLPCRLNFMSLCCEKNAMADDIIYNFDENYRLVEQVDFTGHIGSMRLAFDLLKKFEKCKDVVFIITDYNANFPHGTKETFFGGMRQYWTVECVKIIHDNTIVEKSTEEIQTCTWRLDEILDGCTECFPNLRKFDVSICATGANFDKINAFIAKHPHLNNRYIVEISNGKVKTRPKQRPSSSNQKAITMPSSASCGVLAAKAKEALAAPIPFDLRKVKKEKEVTEEERPLTHASLLSGFEKQLFVPSITGQELPRPSRFTEYGNNVPSQYSIPPTGEYANSLTTLYAPVENKPFKAITYKEEADTTTSDLRQQPLSQNEPHSSRSVSGTDYLTSQVQGTHQRLVPRESTESRFSELSENDNARLQFARNPSPPPMSERQLATSSRSRTSSTENYANNEVNQVYESESRRRVPQPPVISGGLVAYSDGERSQELLDEPSASTSRSRGQVGAPKDPRVARWQRSPSRSSSPHQRDFNRSRTHRHRIHPPSHSRSPRRNHSRSQSRSPRRKYSRSESRSPQREYSRSPSRTASPSPNSRSHRHHHSGRKRFAPHSRRSRSRSSSVSSRSDSNHNYRSAGRGNYRGGFRGQYNPANRRARGRGIRGGRFRGRGRGRGNRGYNKQPHYSGSSYYVPAHRQEHENWEGDAQDQNVASCNNSDETERFAQT